MLAMPKLTHTTNHSMSVKADPCSISSETQNGKFPVGIYEVSIISGLHKLFGIKNERKTLHQWSSNSLHPFKNPFSYWGSLHDSTSSSSRSPWHINCQGGTLYNNPWASLDDLQYYSEHKNMCHIKDTMALQETHVAHLALRCHIFYKECHTFSKGGTSSSKMAFLLNKWHTFLQVDTYSF